MYKRNPLIKPITSFDLWIYIGFNNRETHCSLDNSPTLCTINYNCHDFNLAINFF